MSSYYCKRICKNFHDSRFPLTTHTRFPYSTHVPTIDSHGKITFCNLLPQISLQIYSENIQCTPSIHSFRNMVGVHTQESPHSPKALVLKPISYSKAPQVFPPHTLNSKGYFQWWYEVHWNLLAHSRAFSSVTEQGFFTQQLMKYLLHVQTCNRRTG